MVVGPPLSFGSPSATLAPVTGLSWVAASAYAIANVAS
jgi:hypothetical protein